ncbi:MAG: hypothetical protein U0Q16_01975 [Bryobacteraceae bacterium]
MSVRSLPARYPLLQLPSNVTFPSKLREAIPERVDARMLNLTTMDAAPHNTLLIGSRVQVCLTVEESGRLSGRYPIFVDLETNAARALAHSILEMADRADKLVPGPGW